MQVIPNQRIAYLTRAAINRTATVEELDELMDYLKKADPDELNIQMQTLQTDGAFEEQPSYQRESWEKIISHILSADKVAPVRRISFLQRFRWVAAAVLLLMAAATVYFLNNPSAKKIPVFASSPKPDIAPGREGAKLKLSGGRVILVDTAKDGLLATEGAIKIYKENGRIVYKGSGNEMVYNEITTDKGRFSTAVLPDGSFVWLNAASSIRYPLRFTGNERRIAMTGQVSFRVIHNAAMPFRVETKGQLVEDIGTEFDVNAYQDEPFVRTTLIEGSASIATATAKEILKAGQQSIIKNGTDQIKLNNDVNIENVIAWRNGRFRFDDADIYTVMRQITRWYDVEVVYEGNMPHDTFNGGTYRNENLTEVLKVLELNGAVHFSIEGKKLIVKP